MENNYKAAIPNKQGFALILISTFYGHDKSKSHTTLGTRKLIVFCLKCNDKLVGKGARLVD